MSSFENAGNSLLIHLSTLASPLCFLCSPSIANGLHWSRANQPQEPEAVNGAIVAKQCHMEQRTLFLDAV